MLVKLVIFAILLAGLSYLLFPGLRGAARRRLPGRMRFVVACVACALFLLSAGASFILWMGSVSATAGGGHTDGAGYLLPLAGVSLLLSLGCGVAAYRCR
ncbi:hypothetical protein ODI_R1896 [Orrella dioscoreae]|uniref:Transmembrane protein n=1 Tax=Orrella dioscoreae TaxID=1851544 RepID=A0A1C3K1I0_9BURK|nr:hypothetical protein ODI_03673 [Orrella dioscoreae]SOE49180.1 hypothetical protein ODI_R1896 [Orrella dioscoreae]